MNPDPLPPSTSATAVESLTRRDDHFYAELSRTNNDLANLQREMARRNIELTAAQAALQRQHTELRSLLELLEQTQRQLREASRLGGMAEVATSVLHNVGNALNSVNVTASLAVESLKTSRAASLARIVALIRDHHADLGTYITSDPKGRHIPTALEEVSRDWLAQQHAMINELQSLRENVHHITGIVAQQQKYAGISGPIEIVEVKDLLEACLHPNDDGNATGKETVVTCEVDDVPPISVEKHKVLAILVNLVENARAACHEGNVASGRITIRIVQAGDRIRISVSDNGVGIPPDRLGRIFSQGFTGRRDGRGFGLHSASIAATQMGGNLCGQSDGLGKGAIFTLELPLQPPGASA